MKNTYLSLLTVAAVLVSCNQDPVHPVDVVEAPDFIAVIDNGNTRATLTTEDDIYNIVWDNDDQVKVVGSSEGIYRVKTAGGVRSDLEKLSGDAGTSGSYTAYYPADFTDNMVLPAVLPYADAPFVSSPMVAVSNTNILPFKSICGMLMFNLTSSEDIVVKSVVLSANQPLSGAYTIVDGNAVLSGTDGVTIDCGETGITVGQAAVPFYIELPAGVYDGFKVNVVDDMERSHVIDLSARTVNVERSGVYRYDLSVDELKQLKATMISGPEFNLKLKQLANNNPKIDTTEFEDKKIKLIEFDCNSEVSEGVEIQTGSSDFKIYVNFNAADGIMVISTAAPEIYTGKDASCMFRKFARVTELKNLGRLNTEHAVNMKRMFSQDGAATVKFDTLEFTRFNTSNVEYMDSMFFNMRQVASLDLSGFDVSRVKSFSHFFENNIKLQSVNLSSFSTDAAEDMSYMFFGCSKLSTVDLSKFRTDKVRTMSYMFKSSGVTALDLKSFNTAEVTDMSYMFDSCSKLANLDISSFDTSNVDNMDYMFNNCALLTSLDLTNFNTISVATMTHMFYHCSGLEVLDLSSFNVTANSPVATYYFCGLTHLKTLKLGDVFILNQNPSYFTCSSSDAFSSRVASVQGSLTIECGQAVAEYIAGTNFRWINSGYNGAKAIPVNFIDWKTGEKISVEWAAN